MSRSGECRALSESRLFSSEWLERSSIGMLLASIALLFLSAVLSAERVNFGRVLLPTLLIAMSFAVFLTGYSIRLCRLQHSSAELAFRETDCEFSSIFQNVLDGILIVDDNGVCLDANPAASSILRPVQNSLVGKNVSHFFAYPRSSATGWKSLLRAKSKRSSAQLVAGDGSTLFVDFAAVADYLPGRHVLVICDVTERAHAERCLRRSERRFTQMADHIQEIFWEMNAETKDLTYVNDAFTNITGHSVSSLLDNPGSYRELIHPEDRIRVLSRLQEVESSRMFDEEFRFVRSDGVVRWIWAKGFPVPSIGETRWLVGTAQDITSRKQAEMKIREQLDAVEAARAEAEALRKSALALSQNLSMDSVLDTLLHCISELVPFDRATVLFAEDGFELMVAREAPRTLSKSIGLTLKANENVFLERIFFEKRAILISDVAKETEWHDAPPLDRLQSWLGIPLLGAGRVLGILSLGSNAPCVFTTEHLRLAKSLAVPAAVAIQNARVHERAEIYAAELEARLDDLREIEKALKHVESKTLRPGE